MFGSNRGVWPAWLWMLILSLLLGWLPFIGPAIAGFVGGLQAGDVTSALIAAVIPAAIATAVIFFLGFVVGIPILGFLVGAGAFIVLVVGALPLLVGALLGGAMSQRRTVG